MNHQDLINTCVFERFQGLLFSDLSGPLSEIQAPTRQAQLVNLNSSPVFYQGPSLDDLSDSTSMGIKQNSSTQVIDEERPRYQVINELLTHDSPVPPKPTRLYPELLGFSPRTTPLQANT